MIKAYFKIGSNTYQESYATYKMIYISSDNVTSAPIKDFDTTSYPEEEGEHIIPVKIEAPFDFKVKFLVDGSVSEQSGSTSVLKRVNARIKDFNDACVSNGNIRTIALYIPDRKIEIVGYPKPINTASDLWMTSTGDKTDCAIVELTIRVTKPSLCGYDVTRSV